MGITIITRFERTVIPQTLEGQKFANEYEKRLKEQGNFRGRTEDTYYITILSCVHWRYRKMIDYKKYINALRKCAKEHENDNTFTGHIIVSDLCRDTANLLETLERDPKSEYQQDHELLKAYLDGTNEVLDKLRAEIEQLPTKTRINWDGCCPDIDYPEIEYVDITKKKFLDIIDKYKTKSEEINNEKSM